MKCNETRELMPDLAAGLAAVTPEVKAHLESCAECAGKLEAFRQTMSLMDEWQAPEPSPYFDVRLRARLREESATQSAGWLHWLRQTGAGRVFCPGDGGGREPGSDEQRRAREQCGVNGRGGGGAGHGRGRFAGAGEEPESVFRLRCAR